MKTLEDVLDRIRKLLALSKGTPNEAEATSAAAKAAALMDEWKLDQAEIELAGGDAEVEEIEDSVLYEDFLDRKIWKLTIVNAVCILNECKCYTTPKRVRILGRTSAIHAVDYTVKYLWNVAKEICDREYASVPNRPHSQNGWKKAFLNGCANRLHHRLVDLHAAKNPSDCRALVLVRKRDEEVAAAFAKLKTVNRCDRKESVYTTAYEAGPCPRAPPAPCASPCSRWRPRFPSSSG